MKKFSFRGARVLDWRKREADAARVAFVRASESAREAAVKAAEADARCERAAYELRAAMASVVGVDAIVRHRNWIEREQADARACERAHSEQQQVADVAETALQRAARNVKVMERLRDRAWKRYTEATRADEMKMLNELATVQYVRKNARGGADCGY